MKRKKPTKTQIEREVMKLSKKVGAITDVQKNWAHDSLLEHLVFTSGKRYWCSTCGHEFSLVCEDAGEALASGKCVCPECGQESMLIQSRKKTHWDGRYFQIVTTFRGWQLIRYFFIEHRCHAGEQMWWNYREVFQKWCKPGQQTVTIGHRLTAFPYRSRCPFSMWSNMMTVKHSDWYGEWMELSVYPRTMILPFYKKIGVRKNETRIPASVLLSKVFSNPYTEFLYKQGDIETLQEALSEMDGVTYWYPSIKIALRHRYDFGNIRNYLDYLQSLRRLGRDTRNPKYICPPDMKAAEADVSRELSIRYEKARRERQKIYEEERRHEEERRVLRLEKAKESFAKRIAKFASLDLTDGEIEIKPLMSIQDFIDEGNAMHHCVFTNEYYAEPNSLILSARKDGERVETIEVDLTNFSIAQCYGKYNQLTDKHAQIIALCISGMPTIQELSKRRQRAAACQTA